MTKNKTSKVVHKIHINYFKELYCGLPVWFKYSWKWKYVTCKNCLKHKPLSAKERKNRLNAQMDE